MECATARNWVLRRIDGELSDPETAELDIHLAECALCLREYRILSLPGRIVQATAPLQASPYLSRKVMMRIDDEVRSAARWQPVFGLASRVIPALAGITLALLSVFAYFQMSGPETEIYNLYERAFVSDYQPHRMLLFKQEDITNATVLNAIAERQSGAEIR